MHDRITIRKYFSLYTIMKYHFLLAICIYSLNFPIWSNILINYLRLLISWLFVLHVEFIMIVAEFRFINNLIYQSYWKLYFLFLKFYQIILFSLNLWLWLFLLLLLLLLNRQYLYVLIYLFIRFHFNILIIIMIFLIFIKIITVVFLLWWTLFIDIRLYILLYWLLFFSRLICFFRIFNYNSTFSLINIRFILKHLRITRRSWPLFLFN